MSDPILFGPDDRPLEGLSEVESAEGLLLRGEQQLDQLLQDHPVGRGGVGTTVMVGTLLLDLRKAAGAMTYQHRVMTVEGWLDVDRQTLISLIEQQLQSGFRAR